MFDRLDPRDRDSDPREIDMPWVSLGRGPASDRGDDSQDGEDARRDRARDTRGRDVDARDVFLDHVDLPHTVDREVVFDGDDRYELNRDESRSLATVGAFRVVAERDIGGSRNDPSRRSLAHLHDQKLVRFVSLDRRDRAVTLTKSGRRLLEAHRRNREHTRSQAFYADASRPRERSHDAGIAPTAAKPDASRTRAPTSGALCLSRTSSATTSSGCRTITVVGRTADGRPDRDPREIAEWAREHQLPCSGGSVEFPDFRIEYQVNRLESGKTFNSTETRPTKTRVDERDNVSSFFQDRAKVPKIDDQNCLRETAANSEDEKDLDDWLGGRDSNPDNVVQRRPKRHR
jgi:hypothetical protein